jgi:excisionase family DNA binding protein
MGLDRTLDDTPPRLALTIAEAAQSTGLSRSRLYLEVGAGRLRIKKSGRRTLVMMSELQRFLDSLGNAA